MMLPSYKRDSICSDCGSMDDETHDCRLGFTPEYCERKLQESYENVGEY